MYENKYNPKFPFFNTANEKELYKSLLKNPEPTFVVVLNGSINCIVPNVMMEYQHWCNNVHMKNPSRNSWRSFWWIFGNYLPNTPTCQQYAIRLEDYEDGQKIMTKLYKRHRARFISYYVNKMRSLI